MHCTEALCSYADVHVKHCGRDAKLVITDLIGVMYCVSSVPTVSYTHLDVYKRQV